MPPDSAHNSPRRGFTLLELSVGIAIIGAVLAVTIPMIIGAKNRSEQEQRQGNIRTLTDANWRARILGMSGPEITTNKWPDGRPGGCDADLALGFYNRNNLLGKGSEVNLDGLVFSNAIWGTEADPAEHFNPTDGDDSDKDGGTSPTPGASVNPGGGEDPWDIFKGLPEIDGKKVEDLLDDVNGKVRIWDFEDEDGNEWSSGVGSWDPSTGKSDSGAGRTGDAPSGGWSGGGGWGSGFVPGGGGGDSPYSGGPTYEQTACNGQTQVSVRIRVLPGGRAGTYRAGGQEPYSVGQTYPMVAIPKAGWKFDRWVFEGVLPNGKKVMGTSTYPAAMLPLFDCNIEVRAEFSAQTQESSLTFSANEGGLLDITGTQVVGEQAVPLNLVGVPSHQGISRGGQQWAVLPKPNTSGGFLFDRWSGSAPYPPELTYSINSASGLLSVTGYRPGTAGASFAANFRKPGATPVPDNCQFKTVSTELYSVSDPDSQRGGEIGEVVGGGTRYKVNGYYGYIEAFSNRNNEQGWNFSHWVIEYVDPVTGENSTLSTAKAKFSLDSIAACSIVAKAYFRYGGPEPSPSVGPLGGSSFSMASNPENTVKFGFYGPSSLSYSWGNIGYPSGKMVLRTVADPGWRVTGLRATKTSVEETPTKILGRLSETQWYIDLAEGQTDFVAEAVADADAAGYLGSLYISANVDGSYGEKVSVEVLGRDYNLESNAQWAVDQNMGIPIQPGETLTVRVNYRTGGWIKKVESSDARFIKIQPVAPNTYKIHVTAATPYGGGWGGARGENSAVGYFYVLFTVGFGGPYINPTPTPSTPENPECFERIGIVVGNGGKVHLSTEARQVGGDEPHNTTPAFLQVLPGDPYMGGTGGGETHIAVAVADPGYRFKGWKAQRTGGGWHTVNGATLTAYPINSGGCPEPPRSTFTAEFEPVNSCPDAYAMTGAGDPDGTYVKHGEVKFLRPGSGGDYFTRPVYVRQDGKMRIVVVALYDGGYFKWDLQDKRGGRWDTWMQDPSAGTGNIKSGSAYGGTLPPECPDLAVGMSPTSPGGVPTPTPGPFDDYGLVTIMGRDGAWVAWNVEGEALAPGAQPTSPRTGFVPANSWTHIYLRSTQKVKLTSHTGAGTSTTIPENPWSIVHDHNASYIAYEPYAVTVAVKPKEEIVITARGSGGPDSSPSPSPSASASPWGSPSPSSSPSPGSSPWVWPGASASPSPSSSPVLYGQVFIRVTQGSFPGSTPNGSDFMAIHGGNAFSMGRYTDSQGRMAWQYGLDVAQWTGGRDPSWPLIVKAKQTGMRWATIPGAVYSSDRSVVSIPKPAHGTTLYLDLDSGSTASPSPGASASPTPETGGWEKVRIESRVSEDPWWFEIKDNYTGEIVGIVGGDSPLTINQPSAAMAGNGGWTQFAVARNYPGVVFRETGNPLTLPHRWQFSATPKTKIVGTLVKGGGPGASPGASASPGADVDPYAVGPICVSTEGGSSVWSPGGRDFGGGWRVGWIRADGVVGIFYREGGYYAMTAEYGGWTFSSSATLTGSWAGGGLLPNFEVNYGDCSSASLCVSEVDTLGMYTTLAGDYILPITSRHGSAGVWAYNSAWASGSSIVMVHSSNPAAAIFRNAQGEYEIRAQSGGSGVTLFRNKTLTGKWSGWRADGRWAFPRGRDGSCSGASPTPQPQPSPSATVGPNPSASPGNLGGNIFLFVDHTRWPNRSPQPEVNTWAPSRGDILVTHGSSAGMRDWCGQYQGCGYGTLPGHSKTYWLLDNYLDMFAEIPEDGWTANPDPDRKWAFSARVSHPDWVWGPVKIADFGSPTGRSMEGVTYSDDFRSISVPKPVRGEIVSIELVPKASRTPDTGEYGWDKLVVKSMVSEDPWYFEVKDNLTGETLGIVGADSPLTLRKPTTAMITKWGAASGLPIELTLARDYTNFSFAETGTRTVRWAWDWGNETRQVGTIVSGAASSSPTPFPGTGINPSTAPTICVSEAGLYGSTDPNGTYQAGTTWRGDVGWIHTQRPWIAIVRDGGFTIVSRNGSSSYELYKNAAITGKWTGGGVATGSKPNVSIGACGPDGSPSPEPSIAPPLPRPSASPGSSPSASTSPVGLGRVIVRIPRTSTGFAPVPAPSPGEISVVHGGGVSPFSDQIELDQSSWTGGSDPSWPLIVRVNIDYCLRTHQPDTFRVNPQDPSYCDGSGGQTTYAAWGIIPGASYSSDRRTISVPKPRAGETLYLDLTAAILLPPYVWSQYGDSAWPTLTINSRVSEDPWYIEVSAANIPDNDAYRTEGIIGIASADSPMILRTPPAWLLAAAAAGQETWDGTRHMRYEGGLRRNVGGEENFNLELFVTRGYPDIVFQESNEEIYSFNWDTLNSGAVTLNLIKTGSPTPTPTPTR